MSPGAQSISVTSTVNAVSPARPRRGARFPLISQVCRRSNRPRRRFGSSGNRPSARPAGTTATRVARLTQQRPSSPTVPPAASHFTSQISDTARPTFLRLPRSFRAALGDSPRPNSSAPTRTAESRISGQRASWLTSAMCAKPGVSPSRRIAASTRPKSFTCCARREAFPSLP